MDSKELEKQVEQHSEEVESGKPKNKKTTIKYIINISVVLIVTALAIFFAIKDNAGSIYETLMGADWRYLLIVVGVMGGCILVRSFLYFAFAHLFTRRYHFHQAIAVDQIGQFYNAITPGASGGQIMQAYTYKKQGVAVSSAVSILAMYSIVYQIILIIFGVVSFIVKYDFITALGFVRIAINNSGSGYLDIPIWPLTIVGFLLNVGVIALVFLMGYWHGFHNFIMGPVVSLLTRMRIVKDPDKTRENLRIQVENFKIEFRRLSTNVPFLLLVVVSFVAYMILKFCIPYFVGLALGNQSTTGGFWDCIFLSNYHQMVTGLIPIPGSAGVSEFVFYNLFLNETHPENGFFCVYQDFINSSGEIVREASAPLSRTLARSSLLIWRTSTFVIPVLIGGFVAAFYRSSPKNEVHAGDIPNRQTFYSLQQETYVERAEEVETLMETTRLSRKAILDKLTPTKKRKRKRKKTTDAPADISQQDYDEVVLDDLEDK